jgi:hypothetical protein
MQVIEAATQAASMIIFAIVVMRIRDLLSIFWSLLALSLLASCSSSSVERKPAAGKSGEPTPVAMAPRFTTPLPASKPASAATAKSAAPSADEINRAVSRVFDKVAAADLSRKPAFTLGDFNGDGSQDLAVFIKTNEGQFGEINNELANWVLEDPKNFAPPRTNKPAAPPVHAQKEDLLLAVIHGVGDEGWHNPEAKQTYVLKNNDATKLSTQSIKDLKAANDKGSLPQLRGDVIGETVGSQSGILYWNGGKYAWYRIESR